VFEGSCQTQKKCLVCQKIPKSPAEDTKIILLFQIKTSILEMFRWGKYALCLNVFSKCNGPEMA